MKSLANVRYEVVRNEEKNRTEVYYLTVKMTDDLIDKLNMLEDLDCYDDAFETASDIADIARRETQRILVGYVEGNKEEGFVVLDPSFCHDYHHDIGLGAYRVIGKRVSEVNVYQLKPEERNDFLYAQTGCKISMKLKPEADDDTKFTQESIDKTNRAIFIESFEKSFLLGKSTPIFILDYYEKLGLREQLNELADAEYKDHEEAVYESDFTYVLDLLSMEGVIDTIEEDEGTFKSETVYLYDGTQVQSERVHPNLECLIDQRPLIPGYVNSFVKSAVYGKYNVSIGCFIRLSCQEKIEVLLLNNMFCALHPEFNDYTIISYDNVLHFFKADAGYIAYPLVRVFTEDIATIQFKHGPRPHVPRFNFGVVDPMPTANAIANSEFKPLEDIRTPQVSTVKRDGNIYYLYEVNNESASSNKKKTKSRKSKAKVKGEPIGSIIGHSHKTGWVKLNRDYIEQYPEYKGRYIYCDGNRLRTYEVNANFPQDPLFWIAKSYSLRRTFGPCFTKEQAEHFYQNVKEDQDVLLKIIKDSLKQICDGKITFDELEPEVQDYILEFKLTFDIQINLLGATNLKLRYLFANPYDLNKDAANDLIKTIELREKALYEELPGSHANESSKQDTSDADESGKRATAASTIEQGEANNTLDGESEASNSNTSSGRSSAQGSDIDICAASSYSFETACTPTVSMGNESLSTDNTIKTCTTNSDEPQIKSYAPAMPSNISKALATHTMSPALDGIPKAEVDDASDQSFKEDLVYTKDIHDDLGLAMTSSAKTSSIQAGAGKTTPDTAVKSGRASAGESNDGSATTSQSAATRKCEISKKACPFNDGNDTCTNRGKKGCHQHKTDASEESHVKPHKCIFASEDGTAADHVCAFDHDNNGQCAFDHDNKGGCAFGDGDSAHGCAFGAGDHVHAASAAATAAAASTAGATSEAALMADGRDVGASSSQVELSYRDGSLLLCGVASVKDGPKLNLIAAENKDGGYGYYTPRRENGILVNKIDELVASVVSFSRDGWVCFETDYLTPRPHLSNYLAYSSDDKLWFFASNAEAMRAFADTPDFDTYTFLKDNKDAAAAFKRTKLSITDYIYEEEPVVSDTDLQAAEAEINAVYSKSEQLLNDLDAQDVMQMSGSNSDMAIPLARPIVGKANLNTANDCVIDSNNSSRATSTDAETSRDDSTEYVDDAFSDFEQGASNSTPDFSISGSNAAKLGQSKANKSALFDIHDLRTPQSTDLGPSPADDEDLLVSDLRLDKQIEEQLEKHVGGFLDHMIDDAQAQSSYDMQGSVPIDTEPKFKLMLSERDGVLHVIAWESGYDQTMCSQVDAGHLIGTKEHGWVLFEPMFIGLHPELQNLLVRYHEGKFDYFDAFSYPDDPTFEEFGLQRFDTDYLNKVLAAVSHTTPVSDDESSGDIADIDPLDTADFDDAAEELVDAAVNDAFEGKANILAFARDCDPDATCRSFLAPDGSQIDALQEHPALRLQLKHDHLSGYMLIDEKGHFAGTLVSQIPGSLSGWVRFDEEYLKIHPNLSEYHVYFDQDKIYFYPHVEIDDDDFRLYQSAPEDVEHRLMQQSADLSDSEPAVAALKEMGAYTSMPCYTEIVKSRVEVETDEEFKKLCSDGLKELTEADKSLIHAEMAKAGLPTTKFDDEQYAKAYAMFLKSNFVFTENGVFTSVYAPQGIVFDEAAYNIQNDNLPEIDVNCVQESSDEDRELKYVGQINSTKANGYIIFNPKTYEEHPELNDILVLVEDGKITIEHLFEPSRSDLDPDSQAAIFQLQEKFTKKHHLGSPKDYIEVLQAFRGSYTTYPEKELTYSLEDMLEVRPDCKVMIVGGAFVDVTLGLEKMPETGGDAYAKELKKGVGGCALNVAHALRMLGINHELKVPIGTGPYADIIKQQLISDGYNDSNFITDEELSLDCGYCMCMVDRNGERTFVTVPGIENYAKSEWFDNLDLSNTGLIYLSGFDLNDTNGEVYLSRLRDELNQNSLLGKCTVFFDAGARLEYISRETIDILLSLDPILHVNRMELELITGQRDVYKGIMSLSSRTSAPVIVSLDKDGCMVAYKSRAYNFKVKALPVIDATGAGDCHCAGIIAALIKGKPLHQAIRAGNDLAARCIGHIGARLNMENSDIKKFKRTYL